MGPSDILAQAEDQDRGKWFKVLHPVTGKPAGIELLVVGPDSRRTAEAQALMVDELAEAADDTGRVSGAARAVISSRALARCVLDWKAEEDGKPVPFSFAALVKLLAVSWFRAQTDTFAADRAAHFDGGDDAEA